MSILPLPPIEALDTAAQRLHDQAPAKRQRTAIDKAIYRLHSPITIVATAGGILVPSFEDDGMIYRVDTVNGCSCKAGLSGNPCKHAAIVAILEEAGRYTMPALPSHNRRAEYEQACADMMELYA